jgi:poly-D-alanine transfer protein DltD
MSTKIQINSLEALERLIGNDNELEIEIRNSVVQNFVTKHLKSLAREAVVKNAAEATQEAIKAEFFDVVGTGWNKKIQFKEDVLKELKIDLEYRVKQEMSKLISEILEREKTLELLQSKLNSAAGYIIEELSKETLERRLNILIESRIKAKLGLK